MPKFDVLIEDTGEHYPCSDARSLLEGMVALDRKGALMPLLEGA